MLKISPINSFSIIIILCLITSMGRFVMDNYLPSLPAISTAFSASADYVQLTLTLYVLGFGLSQLIYGPLSDRLGRKKVLIGGLILFLMANTLCMFTHSLSVLLLARLLSGLGMGVCGVLNRAIASDCFHGAEFSKAWSYTTTTLVIVLIIAPLIGSGVQELFDWRANFTVSTLFVGIALLIIFLKLPETHHHKLTSMTFKKVITNYQVILTSRSFIVSTLCYTFAFAGLIAYFQISPFLLMNVFHLSPVQYGYTSLIIAASYLTGGLLVNRLAHILGIKLLLIIGIALIISSGTLMITWNIENQISLVSVLLPTALYVVGARIIIPNAMAGAFTGFRHLGGSTSGLIGGIQMLGTALISSIMVNFNYRSPLPLAFLFTLLGTGSLIAFCYMYFYKNKYLYKNFVHLWVGAIQLHDQYIQRWGYKYFYDFDTWLLKKYKMNTKQVLKTFYINFLQLNKKLLQFCCKYKPAQYVNRYSQYITQWFTKKYGYRFKNGFIKLKLLIQKWGKVTLKRIQATKLYQYCHSAIKFAVYINNKRTKNSKIE